jgi:integrase
LVFPGVKGGPIRRGNFNKMAAWPQAVASIGMPGLHFHDLRHTGNQFAANSGAGLRDLILLFNLSACGFSSWVRLV